MRQSVKTFNFLSEKPSLTKNELIILDYINNYNKNCFIRTIEEFSSDLNTSPSAITRFIKKYEFKTYKDFLIFFNNLLTKKEKEQELTLLDKQLDDFHKHTEKYKRYLDMILSEENQKEISKLLSLILKSKSIMIFGMGSSSLCAQELSNNLLKIGFNVFRNYDMHLFIGVLANSNNNDLVIIISNKMSSLEIDFVLKISKINKIKVAIITSTNDQSILSLADVKINYKRIYNTQKFVSVSSKIYQLLISDMIFEKLINTSHKLTKNYERGQHFLNLWLNYAVKK